MIAETDAGKMFSTWFKWWKSGLRTAAFSAETPARSSTGAFYVSIHPSVWTMLSSHCTQPSVTTNTLTVIPNLEMTEKYGLGFGRQGTDFFFSWGNKWNCFFVFSLWYFKNVTYNVYCSSAMRNLSWKRCEKEEAVLFRCLIRASDLAFLSSYNYVKQLMIYLSCVKYVVLKYLI